LLEAQTSAHLPSMPRIILSVLLPGNVEGAL
jgi:hypothetical protein